MIHNRNWSFHLMDGIEITLQVILWNALLLTVKVRSLLHQELASLLPLPLEQLLQCLWLGFAWREDVVGAVGVRRGGGVLEWKCSNELSRIFSINIFPWINMRILDLQSCRFITYPKYLYCTVKMRLILILTWTSWIARTIWRDSQSSQNSLSLLNRKILHLTACPSWSMQLH